MSRTAQVASAVLVLSVVFFAARAWGTAGVPDMASPPEIESGRALAQSGYPGGTPGPAPTQTDIPAAGRKYDGWDGEDIADDFINLYEGGLYPVASAPTTYVESTTITTADAEGLGMDPDQVAFQSPTDVAIILSGEFKFPLRGATLVTPAPVSYILIVVDTYSGSVRLRVQSDTLSELQAMLP